MGQAKLKKLAGGNKEPSAEVINKIAASVRKLMEAASAKLGLDCYSHAVLAAHLLRDEGFDPRVVIGNCMWRVGEGDGDVITHMAIPGAQQFADGSGPALPYHAWVEVGHHILDVTTYQIPIKAKRLDEADGGHTSVNWAPAFLYANKKTVSSRENVTNLHAGLYFYQHAPSVESTLLAAAKPVPEEDLSYLRIIYNSDNDLLVLGPNHMGEKS